jgi:hypothetical protein
MTCQMLNRRARVAGIAYAQSDSGADQLAVGLEMHGIMIRPFIRTPSLMQVRRVIPWIFP